MDRAPLWPGVVGSSDDLSATPLCSGFLFHSFFPVPLLNSEYSSVSRPLDRQRSGCAGRAPLRVFGFFPLHTLAPCSLNLGLESKKLSFVSVSYSSESDRRCVATESSKNSTPFPFLNAFNFDTGFHAHLPFPPVAHPPFLPFLPLASENPTVALLESPLDRQPRERTGHSCPTRHSKSSAGYTSPAFSPSRQRIEQRLPSALPQSFFHTFTQVSNDPPLSKKVWLQRQWPIQPPIATPSWHRARPPPFTRPRRR